MPSTKEIRGKIKSVQNTRKITKAMEMVAASKMRKAQDRMRAARPYADKVRNIIAHLASARADYSHPFLVKHKVQTGKAALIMVTTDKGLAGALKEKGYGILLAGEMGIGNTTTSSAVVSVLLDQDAEDVTGRGAGLSSEGLKRKVQVIRESICLNQPDRKDVLDVLSKVGGLDIAGLAGVFLGGAICHIPVMIDGFISSAAALCAVRMVPECADYMLASHRSGETAGGMVLEALGLSPFLDCNMSLGEGSGAVAAMPLLDMGLSVYLKMSTFEEIKVEQSEECEEECGIKCTCFDRWRSPYPCILRFRSLWWTGTKKI